MIRWRPLLLALVLAPLAHADHFTSWDPPLEVGPFSLTERSGKTVTREDLRGKIWVAHFFYCTCQEGCAQTTATMARLQTLVADRPNIRLVSIHLFPQSENLDLLRQYAKDHSADFEQWLFLTGDKDTVYKAVQKSFFLPVEEREEKTPGKEIEHRFWLLLIDGKGRIVGKVENGKDASCAEELAKRMKEMEPPVPSILPSINAGLNATCTVLLIVGFLAIRRRQETFHKVCMLSALVVSAVFLTSYLYYHFVIRDGKPTSFSGEGWIRPVYYVVLLSHTVLAALVAPLALTTAYLGLRNRRAAHRRLARWTFPIWLYVSITGVVVYWILYQLYPSG